MSKRRAGHDHLVLFQLLYGNISPGLHGNVSLGLVSGQSKGMRLTSRSAFMARNVFSLCVGRRLAGTDILHTKEYSPTLKKKKSGHIYCNGGGRF